MTLISVESCVLIFIHQKKLSLVLFQLFDCLRHLTKCRESVFMEREIELVIWTYNRRCHECSGATRRIQVDSTNKGVVMKVESIDSTPKIEMHLTISTHK